MCVREDCVSMLVHYDIRICKIMICTYDGGGYEVCGWGVWGVSPWNCHLVVVRGSC